MYEIQVLCRTQNKNEAYQEFVTALREYVKDCGYVNPDKMVRERVLFWIRLSKKNTIKADYMIEVQNKFKP